MGGTISKIRVNGTSLPSLSGLVSEGQMDPLFLSLSLLSLPPTRRCRWVHPTTGRRARRTSVGRPVSRQTRSEPCEGRNGRVGVWNHLRREWKEEDEEKRLKGDEGGAKRRKMGKTLAGRCCHEDEGPVTQQMLRNQSSSHAKVS